MPKSCIYKIILGGASGSGKTTFINGDSFYDANDFFHIGVSFKLIECTANDDSYLMQIWDLKALNRFNFLFNGFCKGAKGAILTFDLSDKESFVELDSWIKIIHENSLDIPIILVGTKAELGQDVSDEEIIKFMEKYNIVDFIKSSIENGNEDKRPIVMKKLIEAISKKSIELFKMHLPESDDDFKIFWKNFSNCPICHRDNHINYLKNFFFSNQPQSLILKEQLLELLDKAIDIENIYYNEINFGIPCCRCYEKIFGKSGNQ